jgi:putative transposase
VKSNVPKEFKRPTCGPKVKKGNAVALDPGVRIFQTTYDTSGTSYLIGKDGAMIIDSLAGIAARMRAGVYRYYKNEKQKFRRAETEKERKGLLRAANRIEQKIKDMISDCHRKTVKFLCDKYDTIVIPSFGSKGMVEAVKRKISKTTARRLLRWSHYRFRELLKAKGDITGTNIIVASEEYTSKTCGNCMFINRHLIGQKTIVCSNCHVRMHRDVNAARNILFMNWHLAHLHPLNLV